MYKFNLFLSFFNKTIALLITFSLLSISFSFNIDKNIKQEFGTLYKSTSICEYYNSIANFSYGVINKILESTNIFLIDRTSKNDTNKEESKKSNNQNDLYFVKTTTEKELKVSEKVGDYNFSLLGNGSYSALLLNDIISKFHTLKLSCITMIFCYFARDSIGDININNIIGKVRLV